MRNDIQPNLQLGQSLGDDQIGLEAGALQRLPAQLDPAGVRERLLGDHRPDRPVGDDPALKFSEPLEITVAPTLE